MTTQIQMVREFMVAFGQECPEAPCLPKQETRDLRHALNHEEWCEFITAKDELEAFDALLDLRYTLIGNALAYGIGDIWPTHAAPFPVDDCNDDIRSTNTIDGARDAINDCMARVIHHEVENGFTSAVVQRGFAEVHRSNMTKFWTEEEVKAYAMQLIGKDDPAGMVFRRIPDGRFRATNAAGKVIKSPSYSPANLAPILEGAR